MHIACCICIRSTEYGVQVLVPLGLDDGACCTTRYQDPILPSSGRCADALMCTSTKYQVRKTKPGGRTKRTRHFCTNSMHTASKVNKTLHQVLWKEDNSDKPMKKVVLALVNMHDGWTNNDAKARSLTGAQARRKLPNEDSTDRMKEESVHRSDVRGGALTPSHQHSNAREHQKIAWWEDSYIDDLQQPRNPNWTKEFRVQTQFVRHSICIICNDASWHDVTWHEWRIVQQMM